MTLKEINFFLRHFYITIYHKSISNTETIGSLVILVPHRSVVIVCPNVFPGIVGGTLNYEELSVQSANWPQVPGRWFHLFHRKRLNLYKVCMHPSPLFSSKKTKKQNQKWFATAFPRKPTALSLPIHTMEIWLSVYKNS